MENNSYIDNIISPLVGTLKTLVIVVFKNGDIVIIKSSRKAYKNN